jgi:hypothetical protein
LYDIVNDVMVDVHGYYWTDWISVRDVISENRHGKIKKHINSKNHIRNIKHDPHTLLKSISNRDMHVHFANAGFTEADFARIKKIDDTRNKFAHFHLECETRRVAEPFLWNMLELMTSLGKDDLVQEVNELFVHMRRNHDKIEEEQVYEELTKTTPNFDLNSIIASKGALDQFLGEVYAKLSSDYGTDEDPYGTNQPIAKSVRLFVYILRDAYLKYYTALTEEQLFYLARALWMFTTTEDLLGDGNLGDSQIKSMNDNMIIEFYSKQLEDVIIDYTSLNREILSRKGII